MFRIVTINLEQDRKRWTERHKLISAELANSGRISSRSTRFACRSSRQKSCGTRSTSTTGIAYNLCSRRR